MATVAQMQEQILRGKAERNVCILAHSYQASEIVEIADYTGDSFQMSRSAQQSKAKTLLVCGVRFMAETAKLLSPKKRVILASPDAGCPMAEQISPAEVLTFKATHPGCKVVAYVNTTAELKTVADVCVTSSSAVKIVRDMEAEEILFLPDGNLGHYVKQQVPEKTVHLMRGCCPVHAAVTKEDALAAKAAHPGAPLLVHPECRPEVVAQAEFVGSTSAIMEYAKASDQKEFIIGTEMSIAELLQYACPEKRFFPLSKKLICSDMKLTTLPDVLAAVEGRGGEEIVLPESVMRRASVCIEEMLRLG